MCPRPSSKGLLRQGLATMISMTISATSLVASSMILLTAPSALAAQGGFDGGGGDGDAIEFLDLALQINFWLSKKTELCKELNCPFFAGYVSRLEKNLGNKDEKALVRFVSEELKDPFGVSKQALFSSSDQSISVSRPEWEKLKDSPAKKYELVAAEILGLGNVKERYKKAALIGAASEEIASLQKPLSSAEAWEICSARVKEEVKRLAEARLTELKRTLPARLQPNVALESTFSIKTLSTSPYRFQSTTSYRIETSDRRLPRARRLVSTKFEQVELRSQASPAESIPLPGEPLSFRYQSPRCSIIRSEIKP